MKLIIKLSLILMVLACSKANLFSQSSQYLLSTSFSIEGHDKRLFNYSDKERLLKMHPEFFGTYNLALGASKKVIEKGDFSVFTGLAMQYKTSTFTRPFDHLQFKEDQLEILRFLNRYNKFNIGLWNVFNYQLSSRFLLRMNTNLMFGVYKSAGHTEASDDYSYSTWGFDFSTISITPEFICSIKDIQLGLGLRVLNVNTIDDVVFGRWLRDEVVNKNFDFYNPMTIQLSISRAF